MENSNTQETSEISNPPVVLSEQQQVAEDRAIVWLDKCKQELNNKMPLSQPVFVIEGLAGTGKTFTVKTIIDKLKRKPAYMAYTGKAALVLNKYSNAHATTIHSRIYSPLSVSDKVFKDLYKRRDTSKDEEEVRKLQQEIDELSQIKFALKEKEDAFPHKENLIVLDECSMVDKEMLSDLKSFKIPIIALGDPGQLPPVKGEGALFTGVADVSLTEIRRQSLDNPIIEWSMFARNQRPLPPTPQETVYTDKVAKLPRSLVVSSIGMWELYKAHDILICWKNQTRQNINRWVRTELGYTKDPSSIFPVVGDKLIITKNDRTLGLFNGLFAEVIEVGDLYDTYIELKIRTELQAETDIPISVRIMRACFEVYTNPDAWKQVKPWHFKNMQQADYGYAITCHKAQGSQWDKVLILEENVLNWPKAKEERAKWLYTAITRAVEKVTILTGR